MATRIKSAGTSPRLAAQQNRAPKRPKAAAPAPCVPSDRALDGAAACISMLQAIHDLPDVRVPLNPALADPPDDGRRLDYAKAREILSEALDRHAGSVGFTQALANFLLAERRFGAMALEKYTPAQLLTHDGLFDAVDCCETSPAQLDALWKQFKATAPLVDGNREFRELEAAIENDNVFRRVLFASAKFGGRDLIKMAKDRQGALIIAGAALAGQHWMTRAKELVDLADMQVNRLEMALCEQEDGKAIMAQAERELFEEGVWPGGGQQEEGAHHV